MIEKMRKMISIRGYVACRHLLAMVVMLAFAVLPNVSLASNQDKIARFSTSGIDCYADGTAVVDGECYALVWSPKGSTFAGFSADGTTVSSADRVVLAAPLAVNGRCRDSLFQIPAATYKELDGGEWAVCLVDTRLANGVPAGVEANAPRRVNRWGAVSSTVKISSASDTSVASAPAAARRLLAAARGGTGVRATRLSEVPESARSPRITAFEVADGMARLTVADTVPYLTYTLSSGSRPDALGTDYAAEVVDGDSAAPIEIKTPETVSRRFFRVTRAN